MGLCHLTLKKYIQCQEKCKLFLFCRLQFWLAQFVFVIHCAFIAAGVSAWQTLNEIWAVWIRDAAHQRQVSRILSNICTLFLAFWTLWPQAGLGGGGCWDNQRGGCSFCGSAGLECELGWWGSHFFLSLFICDLSSLYLSIFLWCIMASPGRFIIFHLSLLWPLCNALN